MRKLMVLISTVAFAALSAACSGAPLLSVPASAPESPPPTPAEPAMEEAPQPQAREASLSVNRQVFAGWQVSVSEDSRSVVVLNPVTGCVGGADVNIPDDVPSEAIVRKVPLEVFPNAVVGEVEVSDDGQSASSAYLEPTEGVVGMAMAKKMPVYGKYLTVLIHCPVQNIEGIDGVMSAMGDGIRVR